ncbi:DNA polymerase III subunit chi [Vannielia litorea]|uniref:DNA polymerase III subunit chi n=1 Tax=Vannielia litorea TaxID=1217970 RepID=UPI001C97C3FD|nr:DNA polymerase III subunit chi [Vannielia litorea]MBY6047703.1 DNA polymerase III subunit chi [Vannielia litorea]MBY6075117.1 DNA polymerase III subunit chi [Vannielia litorea]
MGKAMFYHLTQRPLEATLPVLLERSLAAGWWVAVRGRDPGRMGWLDEKLWQGPDEQFLAHGLAGGPHDALQPVLLTTEAALPNGATCLMAVDGAAVEAGEVAALERVCVLFDGHDPDAVQHARGQWKALTGAGAAAEYWSEESGRWEKKAESGG